MSITYEPRNGTVAYRVLQHLQTLPAGAELALLSAEEVEQLLGYIHQLRVTLA